MDSGSIVSTLLTGLLCLLILGLLLRWLLKKFRANKARREWKPVEATIESSGREVVATERGVTIELPVFAFSYVVGDDRFGGRFALLPYITDPGESILANMIGRQLSILYDPDAPSNWLIPDDMIEGCKVEQTADPRVGIDLSPKD